MCDMYDMLLYCAMNDEYCITLSVIAKMLGLFCDKLSTLRIHDEYTCTCAYIFIVISTPTTLMHVLQPVQGHNVPSAAMLPRPVRVPGCTSSISVTAITNIWILFQV